jgi:hypothetical protein
MDISGLEKKNVCSSASIENNSGWAFSLLLLNTSPI